MAGEARQLRSTYEEYRTQPDPYYRGIIAMEMKSHCDDLVSAIEYVWQSSGRPTTEVSGLVEETLRDARTCAAADASADAVLVPFEFAGMMSVLDSWAPYGVPVAEAGGVDPAPPLQPSPDEPAGGGSGEDPWEDVELSGGRSCVYNPTINNDWHDDYVCGGERQYFLPEDDYVTRDELDAAAREWEASQ